MNTYEVIFDEHETEGVYAVSLVKSPAMKGLFVALKNQFKGAELKFSTINKEQRLLLGVALIPDKPIYRNVDGKEFDIVFRADTIKSVAHNFLKKGFQLNSSIEHEGDPIEGVSVVESWIVDDPKKDKSVNYNMEYPKGSWVIAMKVDSDEVWNNYIKTGEVKGFSIDGFFNLKSINLKTDHSMSKNTLASVLKKSVGDLATKLGLSVDENGNIEVQLASMKLEDGETEIWFEGETLSVGANVFITNEEGDRIPLPVGEYKLESGITLVVAEDAEGVVAELREAEETSEGGDEVELNEEMVKQIEKFMAGLTDQSTKKIEELEQANLTLKSELDELKKELKKSPGASKIKLGATGGEEKKKPVQVNRQPSGFGHDIKSEVQRRLRG